MSIKTIKQASGSKDCLACVAAMATSTTVKEFKRFYVEENLPFDDDITFIRYADKQGYMVGVFAPGDKRFSMSQLECVNLLGGPAYIIVESDQEWVRKIGGSHAIYWDGETVHDPAPNVTEHKLSHYKVLMCLNLVKVAGHPRWFEAGATDK